VKSEIQRWLHDTIETHFAECPTAGGVEMCEHLAGFVSDPEWRDAAGCTPSAWAYEQAAKALNAKTKELAEEREQVRSALQVSALMLEALGGRFVITDEAAERVDQFPAVYMERRGFDRILTLGPKS
jgi:F420-0:gamma-glutamyl ligase-like protein